MSRYLRERALLPPLIPTPPHPDLNLVVTLPAKNEPDLVPTALASLAACHRPPRPTEVIVVVNTSAADPPETHATNTRIAHHARDWARRHSTPDLTFHVLLHTGLPKKHAGVGLARKIAMDEATRRLTAARHPDGVIACFDADATCDANYLHALQNHFASHPDHQAAAIDFGHPTAGTTYPPEVYHAVTLYELHLRYLVEAQRTAGFPFACHTVGSSMAVRADAYQQQNGMNRRKAGEDFYFLHKFTPLGRVGQIDTTRVSPSPRVSHRVPFGTGVAVAKTLDRHGTLDTHNLQSFLDLKTLFDHAPELFDQPALPTDLPGSVTTFLDRAGLLERLGQARRHAASPTTFTNRFFRTFDAFQIVKFLHHAREHHHPDTPVTPTAASLANLPSTTLPLELLAHYRSLQRHPNASSTTTNPSHTP